MFVGRLLLEALFRGSTVFLYFYTHILLGDSRPFFIRGMKLKKGLMKLKSYILANNILKNMLESNLQYSTPVYTFPPLRFIYLIL